MKTKHIVGLLFVAAALFITGCTTAGIETPPGSGNYETNIVVHPKVTAGIETAHAVNAATAPANPYAPLITAGLTATTTILGVFATWANEQRKKKAAALQTVVAGVEQGGDAKTKTAINTMALANGTQPTIEKTVNPT